MILGIDPSLQSTGLCALVDSTCADTAVLKFPSTQGMDRLRKILAGLKDFVNTYGGPGSFELAAIEGYAFAGSGKTFHLGELGGLIRYHLDLWEIPYIVVGPGQLKTFWTGNARADKVQMCTVTKLVYDRDFIKTDWTGRLKGKSKPDNWGAEDKHWLDDENDAFALANVGALYVDLWDRTPTLEQRAVIQAVKLDPQGILSASAKERNADKDAKKRARR